MTTYNYESSEHGICTTEQNADKSFISGLAALKGTLTTDGEHVEYYDDASMATWRVERSDVERLGAALLDGRGLLDVLSLWSCSTTGIELEAE